jgi:hypothetical protein
MTDYTTITSLRLHEIRVRMFGSILRGNLELILETATSKSIINFYTQIYYSTHFYMNIFKYKSFYLQFNFNQNQFYGNLFLQMTFDQHPPNHTLG